MIKVCEVITDTNIGGAGRLLLTRFELSDKSHFEESVIVPQGSELIEEFEKIGYSPYIIKYGADRSFDIRAIFSLYRLFMKYTPDIVNCHSSLSGRIAAWLAGVRIRIYTRHCAFTPSKIMTLSPVKKINNIMNRLLNTRIIAVADAAAHNLVDMGVSRDQIDVVINGVKSVERYSEKKRNETRKKLNIPDDSFVCGICARLEECKGIDTILRAARILLNEDKKYYFMILGKGSLENELHSLAGSLDIIENVNFLGFTSDITPYINCFDLNLNASRGTETSSLALSEGMSLSLPCVASDWGGNPYMVKDGYNGIIYPTDDFVSLAGAIRRLASNKALYEYMSKNALSRYNNELNAENMARKTEEIYSALFLAKNSDKKRRRNSKIYQK